MEAPGAPPRTLTWKAMEQIRYLHKEFAESWSVPRLAEGFGVSSDVIRRVLKSKFVPTLEQKLKQDQKVLKKAGLAHSLQQLPSSGDTLKSLSASHSGSGSLLMPRGESSSFRGWGHSTALHLVELNTHGTNTPRRQKGGNKGVQVREEERSVPVATTLGHQRELQNSSTSNSESERGTDGYGLPSDMLEDLKAQEPGDQNFSSKVVQRGREFFDSNGNFLYRI